VDGVVVGERLEIDPVLAVRWTGWRNDKLLPMLVRGGYWISAVRR
jgi:hypothetical protein